MIFCKYTLIHKDKNDSWSTRILMSIVDHSWQSMISQLMSLILVMLLDINIILVLGYLFSCFWSELMVTAILLFSFSFIFHIFILFSSIYQIMLSKNPNNSLVH
jgi:magnesium-transporting ATPase (P-type)